MYRRQPTFSELIQGMASGAAPGPAEPQATGGMSPGAAGVLNSLEQEAFAPDPAMPEPEKLGIGRKIALALASGLGSYGAGLQGRGPVDYVTPELDRRTADRDRNYALALRGAGQKRDAARFKIGRIEREQDQAADATAKKEERAYRETVAKGIADAKTAADAADDAQKMALFNAQKEWDLKLQKANFAHDESIAKLRTKSTTDPLAKEDRKDLGPILAAINAAARTAKADIAAGTTTAEALSALVDDAIEEATLATPEARQAAEAYKLKKLGPIFREVEVGQMNQGLAEGSPPQREPGLFDPLRRLAAARAGR